MISKIKIKGQNKLFENTSLQFTPIGMMIRVSLNIEPKLIKYLSPNNIEQGEKKWVYCLKKHIESKYINNVNFEKIQETLLNRCMINIREAKKKMLEKEIKTLKKK
jgi:hypothetical protein